MASIADLLITGAQDSTKEMGRRTQDSIKTAAELGLRQEALQQKKLQMVQAKQTLDLNKAKFVNTAINTLDKYKDDPKLLEIAAVRLDKAVAASGAGELFGEEARDALKKSASYRAKNKTLVSWFTAGKDPEGNQFGLPEYTALVNDIDKMANVPEAQPEFLKAAKEQAARRTTLQAAQLRANEAAFRQDTKIDATRTEAERKERSVGKVVERKKLAAEASAFTDAGGEAAIRSRIRKIGGVIKQLESGEIKTGGFFQSLPLTGGSAADKVFRKKFREASGTVKGAIDVKKILDSQFSAAELLEAQANLGMDGSLGNEANIRKLKELRRTMSEEVDKKVNEIDTARERGFLDPASSEKKAPGGKGKANLKSALSAGGEKAAKAMRFLRQRAEKTGQKLEDLVREVNK